ncbi:multi antimicrobial extrusion protein MatE [Pseudogracilibacillus sp. SE30717A]|uniref:multi antimicrobial extrusion protein MatE n=1 Tax=Pseudogracilibacillus sp. SE30717A TaxID=3098293 RepID=UPI00300E3D66
MQQNDRLTYKQLSAFFIPLGVSASLTSITHVIINGTLSRGEDAAFIIACYAVAMSVFGIIERPMIVFRQASSTLVNDRKSFKTLSIFFLYILAGIMVISAIIIFTTLGDWMYIQLFNATPDMLKAISITFQVLIIVIIFSGIRGLYQGIIIQKLATNWLTIGVIVRLLAMFLLAFLFVVFDYITSVSGAYIFLLGMIIECVVSVFKANSLLKTDFANENTDQLSQREISTFYFPLVCYFMLQTLLIPIIYILLAKSSDIEMSIASFALAFSITNLMLSFFMYAHQLVLQFYQIDKKKVITFFIISSIIPTLLLCVICYTSFGMIFMQNIMGADETLAITTIAVLKFFIIKTLIFPFVDFLNGFLMLSRQTNRMLLAQVGNLIFVVISLIIFVRLWPDLNGINGSIAASIGEIAGFLIVGIIVYKMSGHYARRTVRIKKSRN